MKNPTKLLLIIVLILLFLMAVVYALIIYEQRVMMGQDAYIICVGHGYANMQQIGSHFFCATRDGLMVPLESMG